MKQTEKLSKQVFYGIIALIVVVFSMFYLIGFHAPYWEDPDFNAPKMTNVMLVFMFLLFFVTICMAIWSVYSSLKKRGKGEKLYNGIPVKRNAYLVVSGTLLLLVCTFLLASSNPMSVNGKEYANVWWLKLSDMFICSSGILILIATGAVVFGASRNWRRSNHSKD